MVISLVDEGRLAMFTSALVRLWTLSPRIPSPQVSTNWGTEFTEMFAICVFFFPFLEQLTAFLCSTKFLAVEAAVDA